MALTRLSYVLDTIVCPDYKQRQPLKSEAARIRKSESRVFESADR